ncbi:MAG: phosphotransacetylase family protein [Anaerolineae bacterium]|jgi:BioD-like phosphotransacetylase family protein|nr:phosphotransacetylase family protein [Anaerolineae bacterium]
MANLYITSIEPVSGKTALCLGIAQRMQRDGYTVGYLKPVSSAAHRIQGKIVDEDAAFVREALGLEERPEELTAVPLTPEFVDEILTGKLQINGEEVLRKAYEKVAKGRDIVILEGGGSLREGYIVNLGTPDVSHLLKAPELVILKYTSNVQVIDDALTALKRLGDSMLGVVINAVPKIHLEFVQEVITKALAARGIRTFAVIPQDRLLMSISVAKISEALNGQVLCCPDKLGELVEHLMVGAMSVDSALTYFRRKPNKAVITGGDRPDIQLAALETSTKCLVLTGNIQPSPIILGRAEEVGVPVILVNYDTLSTVEIIERFFGKTRFHQEKKLQRFAQMLEERFDFDELYRALGLTK